MKEDVKHQAHYDNGEIQPIEFMQSNMTVAAFEGFLKGNVIKYVARYENKNGLQDLKKARVYLDWLIDSVNNGKGFELFPEKVEPMEEPNGLKIGDICSDYDDDIVVITKMPDVREGFTSWTGKIIATGDPNDAETIGETVLYEREDLEKLTEKQLLHVLN